MGLISGILKLPTAPARGAIWIAQQLRDQAAEQYYNPARIRQELDEVERLREEGKIDEEEADRREEELILRPTERPMRE